MNPQTLEVAIHPQPISQMRTLRLQESDFPNVHSLLAFWGFGVVLVYKSGYCGLDMKYSH